tara:strand:- start:10838 stop:11743 length:906 start_codon:yes stop_codon:yes gene_type:complete
MAENKGNSENTNQDMLDQVADSVMDDSDFFDNLEQQVNGIIADPEPVAPREEQVTQASEAAPVNDAVETPDSRQEVDWDSESNPYKKRYSDSSRENQRNQEYIQDTKKYGAIIDVMKKDPGLVGHVKNYLEGSVQPNKVDVPKDFVFDPDEAFADPGSTSAKVFEKVVTNIVDAKVRQSENKVATAMEADAKQQQQRVGAEKWMKENNVSQEEFNVMMEKANSHTISYDDINLILNKDKFAKNVADNQRREVAKQAENARNIATPNLTHSASADTTAISEDDRIFNSLMGFEDSEKGMFDS